MDFFGVAPALRIFHDPEKLRNAEDVRVFMREGRAYACGCVDTSVTGTTCTCMWYTRVGDIHSVLEIALVCVE